MHVYSMFTSWCIYDALMTDIDIRVESFIASIDYILVVYIV